jgi:formylglycine-generating enzyme required for sulfatase activity
LRFQPWLRPPFPGRREGRRRALATVLGVFLATVPVPAAAQLLSTGTEPLPRFRDCALCPEMVVVPPGSFEMGASDDDPEAYDDELPRRRVTIGYSFGIGVTEVTFAQWDVCVAHGGCRHRPDDRGWGRGDMPVMDVSWNDAQEYVAWQAAYTGYPYRLPSEAEWEYAARAGAGGPFFWAGDRNRGCRYANMADASAAAFYPDWETVACDDGFAHNAPVASFRPNAFGLHDVLGNVWEWVEDCWSPSYGGAPSDGSPVVSGACRERVLRGGAATGLPGEVRLSQRGANDPELRAVYNGLRVVVPLGN